jgi:hypothetical protein
MRDFMYMEGEHFVCVCVCVCVLGMGQWHEVNRDFCMRGFGIGSVVCSVMFVAGATPVSILIRSTYKRLTLRRGGMRG